jgi:hypothetical protein
MKTKPSQRLITALLGFACACAAGFTITVHAQHDRIGTNEIAFADFDNAGSVSYGYFYGNNDLGTYLLDSYYTDPIIDPTNGPIVFRYTFDNTDLLGTTGYGTGFGTGNLPWTFDWTLFNSYELADYVFSWDARVEGLAEGQTTANCEMQIRLDSTTLVLQKNFGYSPGSNWTHFVFTLENGGFAENTSYTTFTNGIANAITGIRFNHNQHEPNGQFGFDADNAVLLDNIKLEVLQYAGPPPPPPPTVGSTILEWNLDDKALEWGSGGWAWSQLDPNYVPTGTYNIAAAGQGVGGSNGWVLTMDNSTLAPPNTPQWAGIGMNGGGPGVDYNRFDSPDLANYKVSFDCRAEGLAPDKTSTTCRHQLFLRVPDDTLQPPDANTDADTILRLDFDVPAGTNWQTVSYLLSKGTVGSGSKTNFTNFFTLISESMVQFQIENPHSEAEWGFDADNALVIDNYRIERLYVGCPPLNVQTLGNSVVVSWDAPSTGTVKLLQGSTVSAVTNEVIGATSPHTNAVSAGPLYFRTLWVPPTTP